MTGEPFTAPFFGVGGGTPRERSARRWVAFSAPVYTRPQRAREGRLRRYADIRVRLSRATIFGALQPCGRVYAIQPSLTAARRPRGGMRVPAYVSRVPRFLPDSGRVSGGFAPDFGQNPVGFAAQVVFFGDAEAGCFSIAPGQMAEDALIRFATWGFRYIRPSISGL